MKLPCLLQWRILKLALKSLFSRPYTTAFPAAAFEPIQQFRGRPRFDTDSCIGCGACAEVCPSKCIDVIDDTAAAPPVRSLVQHLDACICCGQCERYCTTEKGIRQTQEYNYVGFGPADFEESCDKELMLCECCGEIVAPLDQLRWLARRLGPLTYTNPTLMLVAQNELQIVDPGVHVTDAAATPARSHRISIQCPRCRRRTALTV